MLEVKDRSCHICCFAVQHPLFENGRDAHTFFENNLKYFNIVNNHGIQV